MIKKVLILLGTSLFFVSCMGVATLPHVAVDFRELKNNRNYNTYTIFFSARNIDLSNLEIEKQKFLKKSFTSFAKSIGNNNAATWVGSNSKYDVKISKNICDTYNLSYSDGPYIIFSKINPILSNTNTKEAVILDFSSINSNRIRFVLAELEQNIRKKEYKKIDHYQVNKQIILSTYDNNIDFINDAIIAILGK